MRSYAEISWLTPYPDTWLDEVPAPDDEPDAVAIDRETIELAFLAALQVLPPRQRAALIARECWGCRPPRPPRCWTPAWRRPTAHCSAHARRCASTCPRTAPTGPRRAPSAAERELLARFIDAHERCDAAAAIEIAAEDLRITMPPAPMCFDGRAEIAVLLERAFGPDREGDWRLLPTRLNRMPAAASYLRRPGDTAFRPFKLDVLRVEDGRIAEITTFGYLLFPALGLPETLSG